jgi:hypothetical protein
MRLSKKVWEFIQAKSKRERVIFWLLVLVSFVTLSYVAHLEGIGWRSCECITIPGGVVWDLNPLIWAPYGASGSFRVSVDVTNDPYERALPPQQHPILYFATFLYWFLVVLLIVKALIVARKMAFGRRAVKELT